MPEQRYGWNTDDSVRSLSEQSDITPSIASALCMLRPLACRRSTPLPMPLRIVKWQPATQNEASPP